MASTDLSGSVNPRPLTARLRAFRDGAQLPGREAVALTLLELATDDDSVLILGEAVGRLGGVHGATLGLLPALGPQRVIDLPLSEAGAVGLAVGLAMGGKRPVLELGAGLPAAEQLLGELATLAARSGGEFAGRVVIRLVLGAVPGPADPAEGTLLAMLAMTPGLTVLAPSDAGGLQSALRAAVAADGPVVVVEDARFYGERVGRVAEATPIGGLRVVRPGADVVLVGWGAALHEAEAAAEAASAQGTSVEVIALDSLNPCDDRGLAERVRRAGRVVVVGRGPYADQVLQRATVGGFLHLESPPALVEPITDRIAHAIQAAVTY